MPPLRRIATSPPKLGVPPNAASKKVELIMNFHHIGEELGGISALMAGGAVKSPPIMHYPLDRSGGALEHMKRGGVRSKILLVV